MMILMMPLGVGWGGNHQNDDVIYEWVLSELLRLLGLKLNTKSSINTHQSFVHEERCPDKDRRFKRFVTMTLFNPNNTYRVEDMNQTQPLL